MGLFPGAKAYFREKAECFSSERPHAHKPTVYITDIMLLLYMFDAYRACKENESASNSTAVFTGSIRHLAHFLWRRLAHPDGAERIESWQTHVATFDVPGCSPRAKEATQVKRSARGPPIEGVMHDVNDDAPLPTPLSACLRTTGFLRALIDRIVPLLEEEYAACSTFWGELIVQWRDTPIRLFRDPESGKARRQVMHHAHRVATIGEGDMSVCYWIQYFNADATLVITKDTDMLLLLALVAPMRTKTLTLRLDYAGTVDYVDINKFRKWLATRYGSLYDAFLYCTLQGNDYVAKVTKGCGPGPHLDALAAAVATLPSAVSVHNGTFALNEPLLKERLKTGCIRGSLVESCDVMIRQAYWYLFYALHAVNGSALASPLCSQMHDDASLFGWVVGNDMRLAHASRVSESPVFTLAS